MDDAHAYAELVAAMDAIGMGDTEREAAMQAVAGLLHLGNAKFVGEEHAAADPTAEEAMRSEVPLVHTVTASTTCGDSLHHIRALPQSHTATFSVA